MSVGDTIGQIWPNPTDSNVLPWCYQCSCTNSYNAKGCKVCLVSEFTPKKTGKARCPPSWAQKSEPKLRASWKGDKIKAIQSISNHPTILLTFYIYIYTSLEYFLLLISYSDFLMFLIEASAVSVAFLSHTLPLHPLTHALVNSWKLTETAFYCYAHSALFI